MYECLLLIGHHYDHFHTTMRTAAVIGGFKRNSRIYVGYSIVRQPYSILSEGVVFCLGLPGARIEHVTERERERE